MAKIPTKVADRLAAGVKRFQPILAAAKARDVGESDTVTIVTDMLAEVFGFDKYSDITSEYAIRGTYCDLATKIDGVVRKLIEVKAIGLELKENHVKQAVDYAANQGLDWVVLTNGLIWRIFKVGFGKPITAEVVVEVDFTAVNGKNQRDLDALFLLCKEGWSKSVLGEYHSQKQALSRYFIGNMILAEPTLQVLRRELRRMFPDIRIEVEEIERVLVSEVLKREVLEGERADEAKKKIARTLTKQTREREARKSDAGALDVAGEPEVSSEHADEAND